MSQLTCTKCNETKSLEGFYRTKQRKSGYTGWCKSCFHKWRKQPHIHNRILEKLRTPKAKANAAERQRKFRSTSRGLWSHYQSQLKSVYGITLLDLAGMYLSQWWKCCGCLRQLQGSLRGRRDSDHIDHDHTTGKIRGILCRTCNMTLGSAYDDPVILARLIDYLRVHR